MDREMKRNIILEHYQNPLNKGLVDDPTYIKININNKGCIDDIVLMVKIDNGIIKDIRFDGEACAISTSATSIMINTLLNKTVDEALEVLNHYENMINEQEYDANILGECTVYDEVYKQPNRKKCALLPWVGITKAINKEGTS